MLKPPKAIKVDDIIVLTDNGMVVADKLLIPQVISIIP